METTEQDYAKANAKLLDLSIRGFIETWTRNYAMRGFCMTYTNCLGDVTNVEWDGQGQPVFTLTTKACVSDPGI